MSLDLSYRIVKRLDLPPSKCAICQGTEGEFVDTAKRFPGHPADNFNVYLCLGCLNQINRHTLDLVPRSELTAALGENEDLREQLRQADRELSAFQVLQNGKRVNHA